MTTEVATAALEGGTFDVIIAGSGGGALVAALRVAAAGLTPVVIEKTAVVGGTTALSHGGLWLPANPLMREAGLEDSVEAGLEYLQHVVGDQGPATSPQRQEAFIRGGIRLIDFLRSEGVVFRRILDYPDYHPDAPGARENGRMVATPMVDARRLGQWQDLPRPRPPLPGGLVMHSVEQFRSLLAAGVSWRARFEVARILADTVAMRLRGVKPLVMGQSYVGHLLLAAQRRGIRIETDTALRELILEHGRVTGVIADRHGQRVRFSARNGVLLAAGGFARNQELRDRFGPHPASDQWTAVSEGDTGDPLLAATAIGAATANLAMAYWLPGLMDADGNCQIFVAERVVPHSILVDTSGARFSNEAQSYVTLGNEQYQRNQTVPAVPAYLIIDARHRRRWSLGLTPPGVPPRKWLRSGHLKKASTLAELARACGIDPGGLERTVERFNRMALAGVDEDFGRGNDAYDRVYGDPSHGPNPCLGTIENPPFYAAKMYPTDVGMAGGLLTDEYARVIGEDGTAIDGLYACGTSAASAMGDTYPGGGVSLGQSSVFALIAAEHATNASATNPERAKR
ncbi:FAD-binding protein [Mycobacterium sp.]|uniref:FAD-binding protein n=1 Tax=Mycobacterium sp. TaxID=1785 RepID=UPI0025E2A870|nr:FAD-binding protein [Mycobacterium sp.]